MPSFAGEAQRAAFLDGVKLLINLLPNTPETVGILNRELFAWLEAQALPHQHQRAAHLKVEADLLAALEQGGWPPPHGRVRPRAAAQDHPFWRHHACHHCPHIAAITLPRQAMDQIAANIRALEAGRPCRRGRQATECDPSAAVR